jgi:hypothetical protein
MFVIVTGVPATCALLIPLALFHSPLLTSKDWIPLVTIPGGVAIYLMTKSLRQYAQTPEMAERFRSPVNRAMTMFGYLAVLVLSILLPAAALRLLKTT